MTNTDVPAVLRLSIHEVARLCELTARPLPATSVALLPRGSSDDARRVASVVAERGLLARGILDTHYSGAEVDESVDELMRLITAPGLFVRIETEHSDLAVQTIYATPSQAVVETHDGLGVMSYAAMAQDAIVAYVVATTRLDDRAVSAPVDFTVTLGALMRAGQALEDGGTAAATAALTSAGAPQGQAASYVDAVTSHRLASSAVSSLCKVDEVTKHSIVGWLDCGPAGYWLIDQPAALEVFGAKPGSSKQLTEAAMASPARVAAVSGGDLLALVLLGLP